MPLSATTRYSALFTQPEGRKVTSAMSSPKQSCRHAMVVSVTTDGAVEHIEMLAQKYLGKPYPC